MYQVTMYLYRHIFLLMTPNCLLMHTQISIICVWTFNITSKLLKTLMKATTNWNHLLVSAHKNSTYSCCQVKLTWFLPPLSLTFTCDKRFRWKYTLTYTTLNWVRFFLDRYRDFFFFLAAVLFFKIYLSEVSTDISVYFDFIIALNKK